MQIVIDIHYEDYEGICHLTNEQLRMLPEEVAEILIQIKRGIPLPKGHGRLIDADVLDDVIMKMNENGAEITRYEYKVIDNVLFEMSTIIEAEREE